MLVVSNYVRGEYIRGYVSGLISLFFAIKEEGAVQDGVHCFVAEMGRHPRKLGNALQSVTGWLQDHDDWQNVAKTLRRLGEFIRRTLFDFDFEFPNRSLDPLRCDVGVLAFSPEAYTHDEILDFYADLARIIDGPACNQCGFKVDVQKELDDQRIDLYSHSQRTTYADQKGYVAQAEWLDKASRSSMKGPTCWYCDRLGDSIITLSAPDEMTILAGDRQSFPALAAILGKPLETIPSLAELKARKANAPAPRQRRRRK